MPLLKNIQFTKLIKINGHLKEFNFRKSNGNLKTMFTIDTCDERNNRISFNMHQVDDVWKMAKPVLPSWIMENEIQLNEVIRHELAGSDIYFKLPAPDHYGQWNKLFGIFRMS